MLFSSLFGVPRSDTESKNFSISGIDYAVKDKSEGDKKVISMSLGGVGLDKSTDDAVIAVCAAILK